MNYTIVCVIKLYKFFNAVYMNKLFLATAKSPSCNPQRPLDVQHVHPRLDDRRHGRSLIVLQDLLFGHRRHADRVGVAALDRGAKLEGDLLRTLGIVQGQLGLTDLLAILVEKRLNHVAAQARPRRSSRSPSPRCSGSCGRGNPCRLP